MGVVEFILLEGVILTDDVFVVVAYSIFLFCAFRYKRFMVDQPRRFFAGIIYGDKDGKSTHFVVRFIVTLLVVPWMGFVAWILTNSIYVFIEGTGIALGLGGSLEGLNVPDEFIIFYYLLGLTIVGKIGLDIMTIADEFMVRMDVAMGGEEE